MGTRSKHGGGSALVDRMRDTFILPLEAMWLEVASYLADRWGLGPEHIIVCFWSRREPMSPELLSKVQKFLRDECGALAIGTVSYASQAAGENKG